MPAILAILTALGALVFWISRAAQNAHHVTDAAQTIANLPRKLRYQKRVGRSGLDLVEDPREAATVLMIAAARMSGDGRVSPDENRKIESILVNEMDWPAEDVEDFVLNVRWLTRDYKQADSVLRPMTNFLQKNVSHHEAAQLRDMISAVAVMSGGSATQDDFIRRYCGLMNLD